MWQVPSARAGFAMCRAGKNVWIFGGEDKNRTVLDEVWMFDTETFTWCLPEIKGGKKPPALAYHTAVSYQSQYILVREFKIRQRGKLPMELHVAST